MNAYFTIVLLSIILFYVVWFLGGFLERLSHSFLGITRQFGSKAWYILVGPGVALHESSHALGCLLTRTPIVEFKPVNVQYTNEGVLLGYVKYQKPSSVLKNAVINLAPVAISLVLLVLFALGATYLVPDAHLGGDALNLLAQLINTRSIPAQLAEPSYPLGPIFGFVYSFLYAFSSLTVLSPFFWIVSFLAMTIMFSNAPSDVDIANAAGGLKIILIFEAAWLVIAFLLPELGWILYGLFELAAVMFSLALAFAVLGYGFFIMVFAMSRLKSPLQILPFVASIGTGLGMSLGLVGTPAFQTVVSIVAFMAVTIVLLSVKTFRAGAE